MGMLPLFVSLSLSTPQTLAKQRKERPLAIISLSKPTPDQTNKAHNMRNEARQLATLLHDPTEVNLQEGQCVRALRRVAAASLELGCALLQLVVVLLRYLLLFRSALGRVDERSGWTVFGSERCALAIQELLGCRLGCLIG